MAHAWNIKISKKDDGSIVFTPDVPGAQPGQALGVNRGDTITWNNTTDGELQLVASDPANTFLTGPIPAGQVSDPIFNVALAAGKTITYACKDPPQPKHSIVVS